MPALLTRMSTLPNSRSVAATTASHWPSLVTSSFVNRAASPMLFATASPSLSRTSATITRAPSRAKIVASLRPMPLAPPVTIATLPFSLMSGLLRRATSYGRLGGGGVVMTTRIGVLVPAGNPTVEPELYRMAPASVTLHFARLDAGEGTPGAHAGLERRLLVYAEAVPSVLPALAAVRPSVVVLAH